MCPHRKALQSAESETTTTHLPESFQKTLKATANLFNVLLNDDVLRIWKDLLNYCSESEAVQALKKWQYEGAYFPKPAEILQLVANERDAQRYKNDDPGCNLCHDGWIITNPLAKPSDYRMKACECIKNPALRANRLRPPEKGHGIGWEEITDELRKMGFGQVLEKKFANGNPRYNKEMVQARALMRVGEL